jgi:hypothetical protein
MARPIPDHIPLTRLGIIEGGIYLVEATVPVEPRFNFVCYRQPPDEIISHWSRLRPQGDTCAIEYLERRGPQISMDLFHVCNPTKRVAVISGPEMMPVTELPPLVMYAAREPLTGRDTLQLFRQRTALVNERLPYEIKRGITLRTMFQGYVRRFGGRPRLYYDVIQGLSPYQMKSMVVRTCEIYDAPCHKAGIMRIAMKLVEPLDVLIHKLRPEVYPQTNVRLLVDCDGLVRPVDFTRAIGEDTLFRFEVVPPDQQVLHEGEFLVTALLCRYSPTEEFVSSLKKSFLFKVVPGEPAERTKQRLEDYRCGDPRLIREVEIMVAEKTLNPNDCLAEFALPYETVKFVVPGAMRWKRITGSSGPISLFGEPVGGDDDSER